MELLHVRIGRVNGDERDVIRQPRAIDELASDWQRSVVRIDRPQMTGGPR